MVAAKPPFATTCNETIAFPPRIASSPKAGWAPTVSQSTASYQYESIGLAQCPRVAAAWVGNLPIHEFIRCVVCQRAAIIGSQSVSYTFVGQPKISATDSNQRTAPKYHG